MPALGKGAELRTRKGELRFNRRHEPLFSRACEAAVTSTGGSAPQRNPILLQLPSSLSRADEGVERVVVVLFALELGLDPHTVIREHVQVRAAAVGRVHVGLRLRVHVVNVEELHLASCVGVDRAEGYGLLLVVLVPQIEAPQLLDRRLQDNA